MAGKTYFSFSISDNMFEGDCEIKRRELTPDQARKLITPAVESIINPWHESTIEVMRHRYGIELPVPGFPPEVRLKSGDRVIVMGVRNLPRLFQRHQYTDEEIANAEFSFSLYTVS
ncbi:MAG: hypothetical protein GF315_00335 [candidate division Zixibacteria bacterium]|nr:hypothetical protein [candidate division Zixibacteria bacterium]